MVREGRFCSALLVEEVDPLNRQGSISDQCSDSIRLAILASMQRAKVHEQGYIEVFLEIAGVHHVRELVELSNALNTYDGRRHSSLKRTLRPLTWKSSGTL